jgi:hypothetical protein
MSRRLRACALSFATFVSAYAFAGSERVELPGFSIVLPGGQVTARGDQPLAGKYRVQPSIAEKPAAPYDVLNAGRLHPAHREVAVSWISESYSHEEWLDMMVRPTAIAIPDGKVLHDSELGGGRFLAAVGSDQFPIGMAIAPCGPRFSVVVIFAMSLDQADQLRGARLAIESLVCSAATAAPALEPVVTLPKDFKPDADQENLYSNADGEAVLISYTGGSLRGRDTDFGKLLGVMLSSALKLEPGSVSLSPVSRLADGSPVQRLSGGGELDGSYVAARDCPDQQLTLIVVWAGPRPSADLAVKRLSAVSCPAPARKPGS